MTKSVTTSDLGELFDWCLLDAVNIPMEFKNAVDNIVNHSEQQKGVLTVIITGFVYKYFYPDQDVRFHQSNMMGGYSGRSFDSKYITPFLRQKNFPAMAESGWLTRSLEQNLPYTKNYPGKISGKGVKDSFLLLYDAMENYSSYLDILAYLFQELVKKRDLSKMQLAIPINLTLIDTFQLLKNHFEHNYREAAGASRLPNIAIYAAYQAIISGNQARYKHKKLLSLNSHTASDFATNSIGDIQINNHLGNPFEGIEIKARKITPEMIDVVYGKIQEYKSVDRYYILSTEEKIDSEIRKEINNRVTKIRLKHGCEVIVNGVYTTLKYFLRLIDSPAFLTNYVNILQQDNALKYEHRLIWNEICSVLR